MAKNKPVNIPMAETVCEQLAHTEMGIEKVLHGIKDAPRLTTWWKWCDESEVVARLYARAREAQADYLADQITSIADEPCRDNIEAQRNRLRVDARKWIAAKLKPRVYGETVRTEHTGANGTPLAITFMGPEPSGLTSLVATKTECLPCGTDDDGGDTDDAIITG